MTPMTERTLEPVARAGTVGREDGAIEPRLTGAIARVKQGDVSALHYIYVRYADDACGDVQSIVRDRHEAEDITQNVFTKLITAIRRYQERGVPFLAWILRVARDAALDHLRARRLVPCDEVRTNDQLDAELGFERDQSLREALERLPAEQREVLVLRHVAGLSPGEIAERLNKTEASIHGLHHRGRRALQATLLELQTGPTTARATG
jgi:RNA polymerase sigma-70 factor (ECF subfamily)